jgi:hypothetical protein
MDRPLIDIIERNKLRLVVCPGHLRSRHDGDRHFLGYGYLLHLYGLYGRHPKHIVNQEEPGFKATPWDVYLRPRSDGWYCLSSKIEEACTRVEAHKKRARAKAFNENRDLFLAALALIGLIMISPALFIVGVDITALYPAIGIGILSILVLCVLGYLIYASYKKHLATF